jgi:hypothetical protein
VKKNRDILLPNWNADIFYGNLSDAYLGLVKLRDFSAWFVIMGNAASFRKR